MAENKQLNVLSNIDQKIETDNVATDTKYLKPGSNHVFFRKIYKVIYFGYAVLDRRYTLPMLPWIFAEIKRHGSENIETIYLEIIDYSIKATNCEENTLIFEHKLQTISKFAQSNQDSTCFTYTTRESSTGPCAYHVFQALDETMVLEIFSSLRDMSKELSNHSVFQTSDSVSDSVTSSCKQYEVLYLGKLKVSSKRTMPSFIDDAVEKFRLFEHEKCRYFNFGERRRHGSGASVSSLPQSLESFEKPSENELQKTPLVKDDFSSSSGVSSWESISHKSLDAINIFCDTDLVLNTPPSSPQDSKIFEEKNPVQSFITHSQSMDISLSSNTLKRNLELKSSLLPPSSLITHTQSLDTSASTKIVHDLLDCDSNTVKERARSCSGDIAKQTSLPIFKHKNSSLFFDVQRRPRAYTSPNPVQNRQRNRTMLFVIGEAEIYLIGTDQKHLLLEKTFNDISHCSQGIKNLDHFGFICRETSIGGSVTYSGYVFRCQSEQVVDEMMQTLKMAFSKAHQKYQKLSENQSSSKDFICDLCPMLWFHRLCSEIEGLLPDDAHLIILRKFGTLPDKDKENIIVKFQNTLNSSIQEQNEVFMILLREYSEQRQINHCHDQTSSLNNLADGKLQMVSKLDAFRKMAKKSLSTSFETIWKLTNREEANKDLNSVSKALPSVCTKTKSCSSANDKPERYNDSFSTFAEVNKRPKLYLSNQIAVNETDTTVVPQSKPIIDDKLRVRSLWRKAIEQQIMLLRMNKENTKLNISEHPELMALSKIGPTTVHVCRIWDTVLKSDLTSMSVNDRKEHILKLVKIGVPPQKRGDIWKFIAAQTSEEDQMQVFNNKPYAELIKDLTPYQHSILMDIGRTFPEVQYFSKALGPGQLALYNVLKAYSLFDPDVGYCQGIGFVAGILLLYLDEETSFSLLKFIMVNLDIRKQFVKNMSGLHTEMYKVERLLFNKLPHLYEHFERLDVTPTLYLAPWLLTLFASQFELSFVSRVFDYILLYGQDGVMEIILQLLDFSKQQILLCDTLEEVITYLKEELPKIATKNQDKILEKAFDSTVNSITFEDLLHYEIEYGVLQDLLFSTLDSNSLSSSYIRGLKEENRQLRIANASLTEKVQTHLADVERAEKTISEKRATIYRLERCIRNLQKDIDVLKDNVQILNHSNVFSSFGASRDG